MSPLIRGLENCLVQVPFFQGSRLLKNDSEALLTDSNLTENNLTDSLTLIHRKLDGGFYFNSTFISKVLDFSNFAPLLAEQLRKKLHFFYFIKLLLVRPRKPKCVCSKQNMFSPNYRSGEAKNDPLEQFVCLQSLNIRIDMTQCVTSVLTSA